jgi:hypothetical protein
MTRHRRSSPRPHQRFDAIILSSAWGLDTYALVRTADLRRTRGILATYGSEKALLAELAMLGRYEEVPEALFFARVHAGGSGKLKTTAEQQQYVGPRRGSRWLSPRLQMLLDYATVIVRAPIGVTERLRCTWTLLKYLMQVKKWRRVLRSFRRGTGTGGANEVFLDPHLDRKRQAALASAQVANTGSAKETTRPVETAPVEV